MYEDLSRIGRALAAPARAAMVGLLLDGQSHTAGSLAQATGVSRSTASEHLGVLVDAGLVRVLPDGRYRRYRIADATTATALESLAVLCRLPPVRSLRLSAEQCRLRCARTCYDHLAGLLGVAVLDGMVARRWVDAGCTRLLPGGRAGLDAAGVDVDALATSSRPLLRPCTDWTEHRPHLAGALGAAVADLFLARGWTRRVKGSRGLTVTDHGVDAAAHHFGVRPVALVPDDAVPAAHGGALSG